MEDPIMGTDNKTTPLNTPKPAQQEAQEPRKAVDADPQRRQAGDKPETEQVSAGKHHQRS